MKSNRKMPKETADLVTFTEEIHNGKLFVQCLNNQTEHNNLQIKTASIITCLNYPVS